MRLKTWSRRLIRGIVRLFAHLLCLYACIAMTLNSMWSDKLFDLGVNHLFSGSIRWERVSWGPPPWQLRAKDIRLLDATQFEVARFDRFIVDDYDLLGLISFTYRAGFVGLFDGHVTLLHRPHTEDPSILEWNIAELFLPQGNLNTIDDGEPSPPVLVQIDSCELDGVRGRVNMGVVDVGIRGGQVKKGFFDER